MAPSQTWGTSCRRCRWWAQWRAAAAAGCRAPTTSARRRAPRRRSCGRRQVGEKPSIFYRIFHENYGIFTVKKWVPSMKNPWKEVHAFHEASIKTWEFLLEYGFKWIERWGTIHQKWKSPPVFLNGWKYGVSSMKIGSHFMNHPFRYGFPAWTRWRFPIFYRTYMDLPFLYVSENGGSHGTIH